MRLFSLLHKRMEPLVIGCSSSSRTQMAQLFSMQHYSSNSLIASAITWRNVTDNKDYLRIKVVNFGNSTVNLTIYISGLEQSTLQSSLAFKTTLPSNNVTDENSFADPKKVSPVTMALEKESVDMDVELSPNSINSFDLLIKPVSIRTATTASVLNSSF